MIQLKALTFTALAMSLAGLASAGPSPRWCQRDTVSLMPRHYCPPASSAPTKRWDCPATGGQCVHCWVTSTICKEGKGSDDVLDADNDACVAGLLGSIVDPFKYRGAGWEWDPDSGEPEHFEDGNNRTLQGYANFDGIDRQDPTENFYQELQCDNDAYATITCGQCCAWEPQPGQSETAPKETTPNSAGGQEGTTTTTNSETTKAATPNSNGEGGGGGGGGGDNSGKTTSRRDVRMATALKRQNLPYIRYDQDCTCDIEVTKNPREEPVGEVDYPLLQKCLEGGVGSLVDQWRGPPRYADWQVAAGQKIEWGRDDRGYQKVFTNGAHVWGVDTQYESHNAAFVHQFVCGPDVGATVFVNCGTTCQDRQH